MQNYLIAVMPALHLSGAVLYNFGQTSFMPLRLMPLLRYSVGVIPVTSLNRRDRCDVLEYPVSWAISPKVMVP